VNTGNVSDGAGLSMMAKMFILIVIVGACVIFVRMQQEKERQTAAWREKSMA